MPTDRIPSSRRVRRGYLWSILDESRTPRQLLQTPLSYLARGLGVLASTIPVRILVIQIQHASRCSCKRPAGSLDLHRSKLGN